jgi:hypothetical protein
MPQPPADETIPLLVMAQAVPDAPSMPSMLEPVEVIFPLLVMLRGLLVELRTYGPMIALLIVVDMFVFPLGVSQGPGRIRYSVPE